MTYEIMSLVILVCHLPALRVRYVIPDHGVCFGRAVDINVTGHQDLILLNKEIY
jgi:hypothetical protein